MTKQELPKEYLQWIEDEKKLAGELYHDHKKVVGTGLVPVRQGRSTNRSFFLRIAAAAVLILAIGSSIWIKRDDIFGPKYSDEQITLAYEHAVKSLAVCANSLNNEMNKLQKLTEISKSLDNIKKLETVINN